MFVELIRGNSRDAVALEATWAATLRALEARADRWLGATAGSSEAGEFVAMLVFESEEGARVTADRLDEAGVWEQLNEVLRDVTFVERPNVRAFLAGDPAQVTTVELIQGSAPEHGRLEGLLDAARRPQGEEEPPVGGLVCWDDTGAVTAAVYRTARRARPVDLGPRPAIEEARRIELSRPWSVLAWGAVPARRPDDVGRGEP